MHFCGELLDWSLTYMKRVGYFDQHRLASCLLTVPIFICVSSAYRTYIIRNDFDEVTISLFKISGAYVTTARSLIVMYKAQEFLNFFDGIDRWYQELQCDGNEITLQKVHEFMRIVKKASKTILILTALTLFYITVIQLLATADYEHKRLFVDVAIPGINLYKSPFYEMMTALQILLLVPLTLPSYVSYLCLKLTCISFGTFLIKDLQYKLESTTDMTELEALKCIKKCVKDHVMIIKYHNDLEVLFSSGSSVSVSIFGITPCVIIVFSTMDHDMSLLIADIQLSLLVMISTFIFFWVANDFCCESENIANAAYNCNWVDRNKEFRKYILLIIGTGQKPLQLTASGIKPINMEFFLAILRCTYSLFTVLFAMKTEKDS